MSEENTHLSQISMKAILIRANVSLVAAFDQAARLAERSREAHLRYLMMLEVSRATAELNQSNKPMSYTANNSAPVTCGFVNIPNDTLTPERVFEIGPAWPTYFEMLRRVDGDTGIIRGWTDGDASDRLGIPATTIRKHRQRLEKYGFVKCSDGFQSQTIRIMGWDSDRKVQVLSRVSAL